MFLEADQKLRILNERRSRKTDRVPSISKEISKNFSFREEIYLFIQKLVKGTLINNIINNIISLDHVMKTDQRITMQQM